VDTYSSISIGYTRRRKTKQKHNTICVGNHYTKINTNDVDKIWALLQTTGDRDETNIILCENRNGHHNTEFKPGESAIHSITTQDRKYQWFKSWGANKPKSRMID
jgi:hypothetical protein